jgi:LuxR family maltose regulon positive regulatory protein
MTGDARTRRGARFALAKFRPTTLPRTLVPRAGLHKGLTAGADKRLTVVTGSAGAGKSVLLSSWMAARPPGLTSWLSCDEADANPVRFWTGFIEAAQVRAPGFGADAADLLAIDGVMSADVTASIANDAAKLPAGSAIIVDDFHTAAPGAGRNMADLVDCWPWRTAQLVLAGRADPPLRLHRLRMSADLCELRDQDLCLSLDETGELLANFGVQIADDHLAALHDRTEGWAAALQMAALTLRSTGDPVSAARALDVRSHAVADYFIAEVLRQQPPEVAQFMLDTSVLDELTAGACAAVTGARDAAGLLRRIDDANLFVVALDDDRTSYRVHHLVGQVLRAELRATDPARELTLHLRAGEWFEAAGEPQRAAQHFLACHDVGRALALLQDRVMTDFVHDPALLPALDLSMVDPAALARAPELMLGLAANLLLRGDWLRGGECLDRLDRTQPAIAAGSRLGARLAGMRSVHSSLTGELRQAAGHAQTARHNAALARLDEDEWVASLPASLLCAHTFGEDDEGVDREIAAALAMPSLADPVRLVLVPGARALAWFAAGRLSEAADAASTAEANARCLGFEQHPFAVDYLRAMAGAALERRDLDTAEQVTERALSISEHSWPVFEFLVALDRAEIRAARGHVRDALAMVEAARRILPGRASALARADELGALLRLSLGDVRAPAEMASRLPAVRRDLLLAKVALAGHGHQLAAERLQALPPGNLTPRTALVRQILLAAAAIERGDCGAATLVGDVLGRARREGFLNTIVTTDPAVTGYLVENATHAGPLPLLAPVIDAALEVRAARPGAARSRGALPEPLTGAEARVLKLLPTTTYPQMAATLYISLNTVKTHLRSIYLKLGVSSRADAIARAVSLGLL